jgi:hypothetical protein
MKSRPYPSILRKRRGVSSSDLDMLSEVQAGEIMKHKPSVNEYMRQEKNMRREKLNEYMRREKVIKSLETAMAKDEKREAMYRARAMRAKRGEREEKDQRNETAAIKRLLTKVVNRKYDPTASAHPTLGYY